MALVRQCLHLNSLCQLNSVPLKLALSLTPECPACHMRYDLARGGCLHFRCTQCPNKFCSGCGKSFKQGRVRREREREKERERERERRYKDYWVYFFRNVVSLNLVLARACMLTTLETVCSTCETLMLRSYRNSSRITKLILSLNQPNCQLRKRRRREREQMVKEVSYMYIHTYIHTYRRLVAL